MLGPEMSSERDQNEGTGRTRDHLLEENRRLAQRYLELESSTRKELEKLRAANSLLSRGEAHMRTLMENAAVGFALLDRGGRIVGANPALAELIGRAPEDLAGENFASYVYVGKLPAFSRLVDAAGSRDAVHEPIELVGRDGGLVPCRVTVNAWEDDGARQGLLLLVFDAREELRRTRRLRDLETSVAEAEKSRALFLDIVSRELRSPAAGIMGMARMLMEDGLDARRRELVGVIHSSASYLARLVDDLVDVARPDPPEKSPPKISAFRPAELVRGVADLFGVRLMEKGVDLRVQIAANVPDRAEGDPGRLRRVLAHLMDNAVKFTARGRVSLVLDTLGDHLRFMVSDTGPGLDPETERALLVDDAVGDSAAVRRYGGLGVGLNLCRRLVAGMGGKIAFETETGRGSEFHFTIPLVEAGPDECFAEPPPEAMRLPPLSILLADANPLSAQAASAFLRFDGHRVTAAGSGVEAAEKCRSGDFDVALLDMRLPRLDGAQTAYLIRDDEKASGRRRLPLILLGSAGAVREDESLPPGVADGVVGKPVRAVELMEAIAAATGVTPLAINRETGGRPYAAESCGASIRRLDGSRLVNLRQVMLDDQFIGILRFFMEDAVPGLVGLQKMAEAETPDAERIAFAANKARGLAGYLGFAALAELLKQIENAGRTGADAACLRKFAAELPPVIDDSLEELKRILPEAFATMSELKGPIMDGGRP